MKLFRSRYIIRFENVMSEVFIISRRYFSISLFIEFYVSRSEYILTRFIFDISKQNCISNKVINNIFLTYSLKICNNSIPFVKSHWILTQYVIESIYTIVFSTLLVNCRTSAIRFHVDSFGLAVILCILRIDYVILWYS